jgi:hypothetical protein
MKTLSTQIEGHKPLHKGLGAFDLVQVPLGYARDTFEHVEEAMLLAIVSFKQHVVYLGVDILDGNLEAVEGMGIYNMRFSKMMLSGIAKKAQRGHEVILVVG